MASAHRGHIEHDQHDLTIQTVIDLVRASMTADTLPEHVDRIKTGEPRQPITGIVTTWLATFPVIEQVVIRGANLIITHEPTFYNQNDETDWLQADPVYQAKRRLIDSHQIVIWQLHDYIHLRRPVDGIIAGMLQALDWEAYADPDLPFLCTLPPCSLDQLVEALKARLHLPPVRVVGNAAMVCRRVALLVGAAGGRMHIDILRRPDVDVVICGELNEWETSEYVRDALALGQTKAVVTIGHANSEEAGMRWLAERLRPLFPALPISHIPAGDPFRVL